MEQSTRMYEVELRVGDVDMRKAAENTDTKLRT